MTYSAADFVQGATELLTQVGYTLHENFDEEAQEEVHWFSWTQNNMGIEVGEDCKDPLVATMTALRHFTNNAVILSCEQEEAIVAAEAA